MTSLSDYAVRCQTETSEKNKSEEQAEMECLLENLPVLNNYFQLHSKIGQGSFSTVYLATLRNPNFTQKYAVKHLTQTCEQSRIQNELRCLEKIGGTDNVVRAELCLRNGRDCVTFIMPYLAHGRFSDYVVDMDAEETRFYMKNLFIALRRVHSFNIIHRDVKPNNFLYNRETKQNNIFHYINNLMSIMNTTNVQILNVEQPNGGFLLVDFGLAELVRAPKQETSTTPDENKPIDYSKKRRRSSGSNDDEKLTPLKGNKRIALKSKDSNARILSVPKTSDENKTGRGDAISPVKQFTDVNEASIKTRIFNSANMLRRNLDDQDASTSSKTCDSHKSQSKSRAIENGMKHLQSGGFAPLLPSCPCSGKGAVCSICSLRQPMLAPRAGTSGFRPPEVLFKYLHQTTAVDMWASGVMMLCILSGCYPFFNSSTDLASLAEIMTVFGTERTINVAKKFGRRILCSEYRKEIDLKKLCKRLRARSRRKSKAGKTSSNEPTCRDCFQTITDDGCVCRLDEASNEPEVATAAPEGSSHSFPDSAYDLLYRLLDLDPTTRITAAEALKHPFITGQP